MSASDPHLGAWTSAAQKTRIAGIHARMANHYRAVKEAEAQTGDEPELTEYVARWRAFMAEMNDLGERATAVFSWVTDDELDMDEARLASLIAEWEAVGPRIRLRRAKKVNEILEAANTGPDGKPLPPLPPEQRTTTPIVVGDLDPHLPDSAATPGGAPKAPPKTPPDPNFGAKAAVVGTLAAATVLTTITARTDEGRAAFGAGGAFLTLLAGFALFGGDDKKGGSR